jgi:transposase
MSKPLSLDLRELVVAAVTDGLSRRQAAQRFGVSPASKLLPIDWTNSGVI